MTIPRPLSHQPGIFILVADILPGRINHNHEGPDDDKAENHPFYCLLRVFKERLRRGGEGGDSGHGHWTRLIEKMVRKEKIVVVVVVVVAVAVGVKAEAQCT